MSVAVRVSRPTLEASIMARDNAENMPRRGERGVELRMGRMEIENGKEKV